jgi:hypothetical protein
LSVVGFATQAERVLRPQFGPFKYGSSTESSRSQASTTPVAVPEAEVVEKDKQEYAGNGGRILVETVRFRQDATAYEFLSLVAASYRAQITTDYGTAGFATNDEIVFFKGPYFVRLRSVKGDAANLKSLATEVSNSIDKGEADIPVLIKHLPNPEEAQKTAVFRHSFGNLDNLGLQQGVLSALETQGNADAALASYGQSKVLLVEFNTPQLAKENDERIIARVHELWKLGEPAPTAYRRVGNYSVFVFDAPDQQAANQLIDQVKYEQVVQWLGENPNILKQAQQHYIDTTLGVLVAVLKASGYALLACLGIGGLAGALLFTRRRAQQTEAAYSDAGGMLRLNLDELTPETDPGRLLRDRN